jgi:hypothetical protein
MTRFSRMGCRSPVNSGHLATEPLEADLRFRADLVEPTKGDGGHGWCVRQADNYWLLCQR